MLQGLSYVKSGAINKQLIYNYPVKEKMVDPDLVAYT